MKNFCKIDKVPSFAKIVETRAKKKIKLFYCKKCDFEFFSHNPKKNLELNKLDISRLTKAGISAPSVKEDFKNGIVQSTNYLRKHINKSDKKNNILEVGCSWGYFLSLLKDFGSIPYGLEINKVRSNYVRKNLKIRCENDLAKYEKEGVKFNKIFLFYVIEYIPNPVEYLTRLFRLLETKGSIIIYTPNKNDVLKSILKNEEYLDFFYDENSVNYFSKKSLICLMKKLKIKKYSLKSQQGYSIINFFSWFNKNHPTKTEVVGGDNYIEKLTQILLSLNKIRTGGNKKIRLVRKKLIKLINKTNLDYKNILKSFDLGNRLILKIHK